MSIVNRMVIVEHAIRQKGKEGKQRKPLQRDIFRMMG